MKRVKADFGPEVLEEACQRLGMERDGRPYLLALSGGCDSSVLLRMLSELGYPVVAAHINYGLRGADSLGDAEFCARLCEVLGIHYHTVSFTLGEGVSVQTEARRMRLAWLKSLCGSENYAKILMAHHLDDVLETMLINMVRGTGLRGMRGIPPRTATTLRPFCYFSKSAIESYAISRGWDWREDSSNQGDSYRRNQLRHHVLPLLKSWNPRWDEALRSTSERLGLALELYDSGLNRLRSELIHEDMGDEGFRLSLMELYGRGVSGLLLWELLKPYGFERRMVEQFWCGGAVGHGACIQGKEFQVRREGAFLIGTPMQAEYSWERVIPLEWGTGSAERGVESFFSWEYFHGLPEFFDSGNGGTWELNIPCEIHASRDLAFQWKKVPAGARLTLLGMPGSKKVRDLLQPTGIPLAVRERLPGLYFGGRLVWVPGLRAPEIFRFSGEEEGYLHIKFKKP